MCVDVLIIVGHSHVCDFALTVTVSCFLVTTFLWSNYEVEVDEFARSVVK